MKRHIRNFFFNSLSIVLHWGHVTCSFLSSTFGLASSGFTLIELLIVFTVMATISAISLAGFSSYNASQQLSSSIQDIKNAVEYAKSQSVSQVDSCAPGDQFVGYTFQACCSSGCSTTCLSNGSGNSYEVDEECSNGSTTTPSLISTKQLPKNISFVVGGGYKYSFTFNPLSGSLNGLAGTLAIKQGTTTKSIMVSSSGLVQ